MDFDFGSLHIIAAERDDFLHKKLYHDWIQITCTAHFKYIADPWTINKFLVARIEFAQFNFDLLQRNTPKYAYQSK